MKAKYKTLVKISLFLTTLAMLITIVNYYIAIQTSEKQLKTVSLPLSLDNIYTEIQKNILQPYLISSMMANDTFVKSWLEQPNQDEQKIVNYLRTIKEKYHIFNTFLVSEKTKNYYTQAGLIEKLDLTNTKTKWYTDFLKLQNKHEINIDFNKKISTALTIFINYKILNNKNSTIGITGVAIKTTYINKMLKKFREKYNFKVTFFNEQGKTILSEEDHNNYTSIDTSPLLKPYYKKIISKKSHLLEVKKDNERYLIHTKYIKDLNLYLMVEVKLSAYTNNLKTILLLNLLIALAVVAFIVVVLYRIIQQHSEKLENLAFYDTLTQIYNRRYFETKLLGEIEHVKQYASGLSVIFIDIDNFKHVNDTKGHDIGDEILKRISQIFKENIRKTDIIARWGGEEFVILLPNTKVKETIVIAEKLKHSLENSTEIKTILSYALEASFGVTEYKKSDDIDTIIKRADDAMYISKRNGKNRVTTI